MDAHVVQAETGQGFDTRFQPVGQAGLVAARRRLRRAGLRRLGVGFPELDRGKAAGDLRGVALPGRPRAGRARGGLLFRGGDRRFA